MVAGVVSDMRHAQAVFGGGIGLIEHAVEFHATVGMNVHFVKAVRKFRRNGLRIGGQNIRGFVSFFRRVAQMVVNKAVDGFGDFIVCVRRRRCNSQQSDGACADFHPRFFRTAVLFDFFDAGDQTVRVFNCAERDSRRAHAGDDAQSVLPERHQFLTAFIGFQKAPHGTFRAVFFFVFGIVFAHGSNGRRGFERRKHGAENNRGRTVGGDF